jgi:hypothetical protein
MKFSSMLLVAASNLFFTNCGDNKTATSSEQTTQNSSSETSTKDVSAPASSDASIVGEWQQTGVAEDKNGNDQLDAEERNSAIKMDDYMKLNSDGSAVMFVIKNKGTYEIETTSNGKKKLTLYDSENGKHDMGIIISVTRDELLIMNKFGGDSFTIWKRL